MILSVPLPYQTEEEFQALQDDNVVDQYGSITSTHGDESSSSVEATNAIKRSIHSTTDEFFAQTTLNLETGQWDEEREDEPSCVLNSPCSEAVRLAEELETGFLKAPTAAEARLLTWDSGHIYLLKNYLDHIQGPCPCCSEHSHQIELKHMQLLQSQVNELVSFSWSLDQAIRRTPSSRPPKRWRDFTDDDPRQFKAARCASPLAECIGINETWPQDSWELAGVRADAQQMSISRTIGYSGAT